MIFNAIALVRGQEQQFVSRVALSGCPPAHAEWCDGLGDDDRVELRQPPAPPPPEEVLAGELDAIAELLPATDDAVALDGNFRLRLTWDASKDRSDKAQELLRAALARYRHRWLRREAEALGVGAEDWAQFRVERRNVASGRQLGAFVLGLLAPLLMIIMVAVGCFYPAVDATAGKHERGTWETLMSVAASRSSIVAAKYLYVATMGAVAGLLNLTAMTVSMGTILAPLLGELGGELSFGIPVGALPVMAVAVALLALFIAARRAAAREVPRAEVPRRAKCLAPESSHPRARTRAPESSPRRGPRPGRISWRPVVSRFAPRSHRHHQPTGPEGQFTSGAS